MQNAVYERKQNGEGFFSLPAVTYSRFGNCPANGLVTEQPQYSVIICIFSTWQNAETKLISNGLRFIFTCPLFLAQPITFHVARHRPAILLQELYQQVLVPLTHLPEHPSYRLLHQVMLMMEQPFRKG